MKTILRELLFICLIFITGCAQKPENNWPQFRGYNSSGIAAESVSPPVELNEKNMLWKIALPDGHSSPCIWGKNIFLTGVDTADKTLKMLCINRANGKSRWVRYKKVDEFEQVNTYSSQATATPATDGERVYFYFSSYGIICYDFKGNLKWELQIPIPKSRHGMGTSPIVTGDLVILNCFGHQNDPRLLAINKYDGSIAWKYSTPVQKDWDGDSYATPVIYDDQVIVYTSEDVSGYNIKTGDHIWMFRTGVTDAVCTPVIGDDVLYTTSFSTYGNPVMRSQFPDFIRFIKQYDVNKDLLIDKNEIKDVQFLQYPEKPEISPKLSMIDFFGMWDRNNNGLIDSTEWRMMDEFMNSFYLQQGLRAIRLGGQGDVSMTNFLWGHSKLSSHICSPLYYNNYVYMIRDGGIISCSDAEDGKLLYEEKLGAPGAYFSSPVAANGRIYVASRNGIVTVIEAGDKLNILAKNDLGEMITATPAIIGNKIYIRTDKFLYAFGN
jgi:outer membrane protein assembly factor BamB